MATKSTFSIIGHTFGQTKVHMIFILTFKHSFNAVFHTSIVKFRVDTNHLGTARPISQHILFNIHHLSLSIWVKLSTIYALFLALVASLLDYQRRTFSGPWTSDCVTPIFYYTKMTNDKATSGLVIFIFFYP